MNGFGDRDTSHCMIPLYSVFRTDNVYVITHEDKSKDEKEKICYN